MDGTIDEIGVSQASLRGKAGRGKEEAGQEKKHRIAWRGAMGARMRRLSSFPEDYAGIIPGPTLI